MTDSDQGGCATVNESEQRTSAVTEEKGSCRFESGRGLDVGTANLAAAIQDFLLEGPGTERQMPVAEVSALLGLAWIQDQLVRELHEWLVNIENLTTVQLPVSAEDFDACHVQCMPEGVGESSGLYRLN